jgi:hypothetical protein
MVGNMNGTSMQQILQRSLGITSMLLVCEVDILESIDLSTTPLEINDWN